MPQPIDMQTELGRLLVAERMQDAASRASLVALQRAQAEEESRRRIEETHVNETPETQSEHVDGDGRGKKDGESRRRRVRPQPDVAQADTPHTPDGEHGLDVLI